MYLTHHHHNWGIIVSKPDWHQHHDGYHYCHHLNNISPSFGSNSPVLVIVKMDVTGPGTLMLRLGFFVKCHNFMKSFSLKERSMVIFTCGDTQQQILNSAQSIWGMEQKCKRWMWLKCNSRPWVRLNKVSSWRLMMQRFQRFVGNNSCYLFSHPPLFPAL